MDEMKTEREQMNLFQYGGLADDGTDIEPQTGNEVPPGSMSEEVRDDVPTRLSEGEYVVPADVVRFFGVKFFEDLRTEAKSGLMQMDQEDRIGGTPVDQNGMPIQDEELSPEELAMLQEALGMGQQGMAEGGSVTSPYSVPSNPYSVPTSPYSTSGGFGIENREYVNVTTGETRNIQFANGQPIGVIPEGFVPATAQAKRAAEEAKSSSEGTSTKEFETAPEGRGDPDMGQSDNTGQSDGEGPGSLDGVDLNDPLGAAEAAMDTSFGEKAAGALAGIALGPLGSVGAKGITKGISVSNAAANIAVAEALGYDVTEAQESLDSFIGKDVTGLFGSIAKNSAESAIESAFDPNITGGLTRDVFQSDDAFDAAMSSVAPPGMSYGTTSSGQKGYTQDSAADNGGGYTDVSGRTNPGISDTQAASIQGMVGSGVGIRGGVDGGTSGGSLGGSSGAGDGVSAGDPSGMGGGGGIRYKGGLITKPNKTKKRPPNKRKKPIKGKGKGLGGRK